MTLATLGVSDLEKKAIIAKDGDLGDYARVIHDWETEPYQDAWEEALNKEHKLLIVCPPDTFKSSTIQCWIEKEIGLNPDIRILWLMNAGEQSQARMIAVIETLEQNNVYREAFKVEPDYSNKWTHTSIYVKRNRKSSDPTLMGCGLNGPYQGLHFDRIIIDDPTDQDDVHSPVTMERQRAKVRGVIADRLVSGGRIVGILTRWGENDLVPTFKDMGYRLVIMPVVGDYPWGPTISNTRFTMPRVEQLRNDKTDPLFQLTYMCNPSAMSGGFIKYEHIRYWDNSTIPNHALQIFIGVDPAASLKTRADYSTIATVGLDVQTRNMYLLDMFCKRVTVPELELEIVKRAKGVAGLRAIGVETVAFQLSLVQYLKRNHKLPLVELPYRTRRQATNKVIGIDKDKASRAAFLDTLFTGGRFFIPKNLPMVEGISYETELVSVPSEEMHDDRMDSTVFAAAIADAMYSRLPKVSLKWW